MKRSTRIGFAIAQLVLCGSLCAQESQPTPAQTIESLTQSAQRKLEHSVEELNALRSEIAAEKLPMAEELTALEEKLTLLRREQDRLVRLVDAGTLELSTIKSQMQARRDELAYIGTLLDEYARTFESKINVCELQYCGRAIEAAKQAGEDASLPMREKFATQLDFVNVSIQRLVESIGGYRFPGEGVDPEGAVTQGTYAVIGPVALFRSALGATGLVVAQSGSTKPLIRPLEGQMQAQIAGVVDTGIGLLPVDPSRGGALQALVQKTNLFHIFEKGGPIMWPLLVASVLALGAALERWMFLMREKWRRNPKALDAFLAAVRDGEYAKAREIAGRTKFFVVRSLAYALSHKEASLESAILHSQSQELKRYRRGISILDTVITLAPLLGLLGTVTGMMGSFSLIGGELGSPGAITGGIAEALIATAFGLGIAIAALLPFNFLNAKTEEARHEMQSAATQLELLVQANEQRGKSSPSSVPQRNAHPADTLNCNAAEKESQLHFHELSRKIADLQREIEGHRAVQLAGAQHKE